MDWHIHYINARGQLDPAEAPLREGIAAASDLLADGVPDLAVDIVVQVSAFPAPQPLAVSGAALSRGRIDLMADMAQFRDPATDAARYRGQSLRTMLHEYHHALRWEGPGYGRTLGEALVSEGLAQVFVHERADTPPEPWETALDEASQAALAARAEASFGEAGYSHPGWFFGMGSLPQWAGYALGAALVRRYLAETPGTTALGLAHAPAALFRPGLAAMAG
ncbi:DUF2268 domain-containing putative Zn-dependent protease [Poseidonocella sp. HB161398]|uniref:DUF2268 domain-containing putative Zn-dependent protease n=1 Tax=Poseidonocella sp. HB161398 TaxID=2320855 RepID=UPI0011080BA7|nr:DUF2268 domain-containing putative Zn-dependent protease [Poseidonocella sp. HB161398]